MNEHRGTVMAIDPGRAKCGVAVVARPAGSAGPQVLHQEVVGAGDIGRVAEELASRFRPDVVLVGGGTASRAVVELAESLRSAPVRVVDERLTTLQARLRYFRHNPPRGLRRLIPLSLQTPERPYDDYVAVILAERYLAANRIQQQESAPKKE